MGHQVIENPSPLLLPKHISLPTWTTALPPGEEIISIISPNLGPVASYGKVLGNRKTLYKYLNAHLNVVITQSAPVPIHGEGEGGMAPPICSIYLLDNAKGTIVYHVVLPSSEAGGCDVKATLTENWLVYHYYDATYSASGTTKGYRMVSVELYEGNGVDDKTSR
jgi:ER membrane protein complex subunit 1